MASDNEVAKATSHAALKAIVTARNQNRGRIVSGSVLSEHRGPRCFDGQISILSHPNRTYRKSNWFNKLQ